MPEKKPSQAIYSQNLEGIGERRGKANWATAERYRGRPVRCLEQGAWGWCGVGHGGQQEAVERRRGLVCGTWRRRVARGGESSGGKLAGVRKQGRRQRRGVARSRRASRGEEWGQGGAGEGRWQASSGEEASRGRENHGGGWSRAPADREEEEED